MHRRVEVGVVAHRDRQQQLGVGHGDEDVVADPPVGAVGGRVGREDRARLPAQLGPRARAEAEQGVERGLGERRARRVGRSGEPAFVMAGGQVEDEVPDRHADAGRGGVVLVVAPVKDPEGEVLDREVRVALSRLYPGGAGGIVRFVHGVLRVCGCADPARARGVAIAGRLPERTQDYGVSEQWPRSSHSGARSLASPGMTTRVDARPSLPQREHRRGDKQRDQHAHNHHEPLIHRDRRRARLPRRRGHRIRNRRDAARRGVGSGFGGLAAAGADPPAVAVEVGGSVVAACWWPLLVFALRDDGRASTRVVTPGRSEGSAPEWLERCHCSLTP